MSNTQQAEAMLRDLNTIRRESAWLEKHLGALVTIAFSKQHQEAEQVHVGHQAASESPDLSSMWDPRLRTNLLIAQRLLKRHAMEITAARVGLETIYGGPGANLELIGSELHGGELKALRQAKARRDAHQGDYRWGEYEFTPDQQPDQRFK